MPTFLERIRSGSIDHALWAAMVVENVRDLPAPLTVAGVLRLAKDGVPGYTTDQDILDKLGVVP